MASGLVQIGAPPQPAPWCSAHNMSMYLSFAGEDLKKEIHGAVVAGMPTAVAMSEPGSGSDVASLRCRA